MRQLPDFPYQTQLYPLPILMHHTYLGTIGEGYPSRVRRVPGPMQPLLWPRGKRNILGRRRPKPGREDSGVEAHGRLPRAVHGQVLHLKKYFSACLSFTKYNTTIYHYA